MARRATRLRRDLAVIRQVACAASSDPRMPGGVPYEMGRTLRLLPAVEAMIESDPDGAARWVERWLKSPGRYLLLIAEMKGLSPRPKQV